MRKLKTILRAQTITSIKYVVARKQEPLRLLRGSHQIVWSLIPLLTELMISIHLDHLTKRFLLVSELNSARGKYSSIVEQSSLNNLVLLTSPNLLLL